MPLCLDIYATSGARTRATIDRFLDRYVDRSRSEDRADEELALLRVGAEPDDLDAWEYERAGTLTHIVDVGLREPWRAFTVYLKTIDPRCDSVVLAFTTDGLVVLGLSIPESADTSGSGLGRELLDELAASFDVQSGLVAFEEPPPLTPRDSLAERRVLHRWSPSRHRGF